MMPKGDVVLQSRLWGYYNGMLWAGSVPDMATFNTLLAALVREKVVGASRVGVRRAEESQLQTSPMMLVMLPCCMLIHMVGKCQDLEKAIENLSAEQFPLSKILLKTLVPIYSKCSSLEEAELTFQKVQQHGHLPDMNTSNALVALYGRVD
jgi:hypothetical protein